MPTLEDLAERVERLLLRHSELKRTNSLLEQQLVTLSHERDSLKLRLTAARGRIDAMLERLPKDTATDPRAADSDNDVAATAPDKATP